MWYYLKIFIINALHPQLDWLEFKFAISDSAIYICHKTKIIT